MFWMEQIHRTKIVNFINITSNSCAWLSVVLNRNITTTWKQEVEYEVQAKVSMLDVGSSTWTVNGPLRGVRTVRSGAASSKNNNCTTITESGCLSTGGYVSSSEDENVDMDWKISCLDNFNISLLPSWIIHTSINLASQSSLCIFS